MVEMLVGLFIFALGLSIVIFAHKFNSQHDKFWSKVTSKSEDDMKNFRSRTPIARVAGGAAALMGLIVVLTNIDS